MGLGGLGSLITDAIQNRDYPVIQASVLLLTVVVHPPQPAHRPAVRGHRPADPVHVMARLVAALPLPGRYRPVLRRIAAAPLVRNRAALIALIVLIPLLVATLAPWLLTQADPERPGPLDLAAEPRARSTPWARTSRAATCWPGSSTARRRRSWGRSSWSSSAASSASRWASSPATTAAGREVVIMRAARRPARLPGAPARGPRRGHLRARPADGRARAGHHLRAGHGPARAQRDARPAQPGLRRRGPGAGLLRPARHLPPHPAQPRGTGRRPVDDRPRLRDPRHRGAELPRPRPAAARPGLGLDALGRPVVPAPEPAARQSRPGWRS